MKKLLLNIIFIFYTVVALAGSDTAIVLIDMQDDFISSPDLFVAKGLIKKQKELLDWGLANDLSLLIFEYDQSGDTIEPIKKYLKLYSQSYVVTKFLDGGFTDYSLNRLSAASLLRSWGVKKLIITGVNGMYCVHDTTMGALKSGFSIYTSGDIVGNVNSGQHLYPDCSWWPDQVEDEMFTFKSLDKLIKNIEINNNWF